MTSDEIRKESKDLWHEYFADAWRESQYIEDFGTFIKEHETRSELEAESHLQPWLHILEDSIQWLANLTAILDIKIFTNNKLVATNITNAERSIWALLGAATAQAVALRRLVISGLDSPARAIARTLDEHLCACIIFLYDRKLAEEFHACESNSQIADFWFKNLNTKAIKKHLNKIENSINLSQEVSVGMREWRNHEIETFSQVIHPGFLACALTTRTFAASDNDSHNIAILGEASSASERTLNFSCKSIWYFCCFGSMMLFDEHNSNRPLIKIDKDDEMHQIAIIGRDVLKTLNRKYWEHKIYSNPTI